MSFFTGGGLLDIGFEESGFSIVWTNELNPVLADMYESAMTGWRHSKDPALQDARISSRFSITELTAQGIMHDVFGPIRPPLFGVIGGPPCVDFCIGGKNQGANGFNGQLLRIFADMIKDLRPDFFIIENVPGLLKIRKHKSFLKRVIRGLKDKPHRYRVAAKIVSALELGVPQNRERLFIIGFTDELVRAYLRKHNTPDPVKWFDWPEAIYPDASQLP